jgi:hypothetical protein
MWSFPGNQTMQNVWDSTMLINSSAGVIVQNLQFNAAIANGAALYFGFAANYTGTNPIPLNFEMDGFTCATK